MYSYAAFMHASYFVYILASAKNGTLYTGITDNLQRRIQEHKDGSGSRFTAKYGVKILVYFEETSSAEAAIAREKQIKNWKRDWKLTLLEHTNPNWRDLAEDFL